MKHQVFLSDAEKQKRGLPLDVPVVISEVTPPLDEIKAARIAYLREICEEVILGKTPEERERAQAKQRSAALGAYSPAKTKQITDALKDALAVFDTLEAHVNAATTPEAVNAIIWPELSLPTSRREPTH